MNFIEAMELMNEGKRVLVRFIIAKQHLVR